MADCILRMCPHAIIVPIRLMMNADYDGFTPRPEPMSAAKAIELAIEADVDIISMSWTIPTAETANNAQSLNKLGSVISEAKTRGLKIPLMFCSSVDGVLQSEDQIKSYPREMSHDLFVIGAAHSETGEMLAKVQQTKHNQVHFGVPGVDLDDLGVTTDMQAENRAALMSHMQKGKTGSSIATAFAAGIAALLIHCMQLGLYYTAEKGKKRETVDDVLRLTPASSKKYDLRVFRNMHTALGKLSLPSKNKDKFLSPSEQFQVARDGLVVYQQSPGGVVSRVPDSLAPIATMIRSLVS